MRRRHFPYELDIIVLIYSLAIPRDIAKYIVCLLHVRSVPAYLYAFPDVPCSGQDPSCNHCINGFYIDRRDEYPSELGHYNNTACIHCKRRQARACNTFSCMHTICHVCWTFLATGSTDILVSRQNAEYK